MPRFSIVKGLFKGLSLGRKKNEGQLQPSEVKGQLQPGVPTTMPASNIATQNVEKKLTKIEKVLEAIKKKEVQLNTKSLDDLQSIISTLENAEEYEVTLFNYLPKGEEIKRILIEDLNSLKIAVESGLGVEEAYKKLVDDIGEVLKEYLEFLDDLIKTIEDQLIEKKESGIYLKKIEDHLKAQLHQVEKILNQLGSLNSKKKNINKILAYSVELDKRLAQTILKINSLLENNVSSREIKLTDREIKGILDQIKNTIDNLENSLRKMENNLKHVNNYYMYVILELFSLFLGETNRDPLSEEVNNYQFLFWKIRKKLTAYYIEKDALQQILLILRNPEHPQTIDYSLTEKYTKAGELKSVTQKVEIHRKVEISNLTGHPSSTVLTPSVSHLKPGELPIVPGFFFLIAQLYGESYRLTRNIAIMLFLDAIADLVEFIDKIANAELDTAKGILDRWTKKKG